MYGMPTGPKKQVQLNKKHFVSLPNHWKLKDILFLFRYRITENWVRKNITILFHCTLFGSVGIKARKTETLDLCQLPCPLYEIQKMINLPASVKIFKNKLKSWETDKSCFHLPHLRQREIIN